MDTRTLKALRASIAHWEDVVKDPMHANVGRTTCDLCAEFNGRSDESDLRCDGCPVSRVTGEKFCKGTPYVAFVDAAYCDDEDAMRCAAVDELEFLRLLLPGASK